MTMPGLPKVPAAERIDLDDKTGKIIGLFNEYNYSQKENNRKIIEF